MSDNNEIRGITTTDSQSTREIDCLCFIEKMLTKRVFVIEQPFLIPFNTWYHYKGMHVWCIFFVQRLCTFMRPSLP